MHKCSQKQIDLCIKTEQKVQFVPWKDILNELLTL